ncbi:hypothetical protein GUJ93_ZPchr0458g22776 [Zizania palustris]|uniref:Uncharacterized protein n=1 Tax=Zizania palustris TaxID=103762 RepID=A0A8J5RDR9_ZIZPA|nr:hypothetical protein GUJ93_ZPchr0458g22776 [Zizania palustris]
MCRACASPLASVTAATTAPRWVRAGGVGAAPARLADSGVANAFAFGNLSHTHPARHARWRRSLTSSPFELK